MTRVNKIFPLLFFVFYVNSLFGQLNFYATIDNQNIPVNSYFEVHFVIENGDADNFKAPKFNNLKLISGPNRMSTYSNINGKISNKEEYVYRFFADKKGKFLIDHAILNVKGKIYKTKQLEVNIIENKSQNLNEINKDEDYFIKAEIDKQDPIVGEQIIVKYKLYRKINISNYEVDKLPDFKGFNSVQIKNDFNVERIQINNKTYLVNTLLAFALWPKIEGKITIDPLNLTVLLPDPNNRNPFFRSEIPRHLVSNELNLRIVPLLDPDFIGLVGKTSLKADVEAKDIKLGEAFALKINIESEAELHGILAPDIKGKLQGFEVYDPKLISEKSNFINGKIISSKSFEYLLVPTIKGENKIDFSLEYFDPINNSKKSIRIVPVIIEVEDNPDYVLSNKQIKADELLPLLKITDFKGEVIMKKYKKNMIYSIIFFMLSLSIIFVLKLWVNKKNKISPVLIKQKRAETMAMKRLKNAKNFIVIEESISFYKEIAIALNKYVSEKFDIQQIDLTRNALKNIFEEKNVNMSLISKYFQIIDECENYTYGGLITGSKQNIFNESVELIKSFESS